MRRECRECFPCHRLINDPGMDHGTCDTHVPWCMSGSLTHGGGENVPGIPGSCAARCFTYLVRGPCRGPFEEKWVTQIKAWICTYKHGFCGMKLLSSRPQRHGEVRARARLINNTPLFYVDGINHPSHNLKIGFGNIWSLLIKWTPYFRYSILI